MDNQQNAQQPAAPAQPEAAPATTAAPTAPAAQQTIKKGAAIFAIIMSIVNISAILLLFGLAQILTLTFASSVSKAATGAIGLFISLCIGLFPIAIPTALFQLATDIAALVCGISFSKKLKQSADKSHEGLRKAAIILPIIATTLVIIAAGGVLTFIFALGTAISY
jgi:hypothetical protein